MLFWAFTLTSLITTVTLIVRAGSSDDPGGAYQSSAALAIAVVFVIAVWANVLWRRVTVRRRDDD